jgi:hypothetical protein
MCASTIEFAVPEARTSHRVSEREHFDISDTRLRSFELAGLSEDLAIHRSLSGFIIEAVS